MLVTLCEADKLCVNFELKEIVKQIGNINYNRNVILCRNDYELESSHEIYQFMYDTTNEQLMIFTEHYIQTVANFVKKYDVTKCYNKMSLIADTIQSLEERLQWIFRETERVENSSFNMEKTMANIARISIGIRMNKNLHEIN